MKSDDSSPEGYEIEMAGKTDTGLARPSNEDTLLLLDPPAPLSRFSAVAGVFDGVGGQVHGSRASSLAARHVAQLVDLSNDQSAPTSKREIAEGLEELIHQLHENLMQDTVRDPSLQGMATTATIAFLDKTCPRTLWIGHVGDSPAFRLRNGELQKLTREDSVVYDLVHQGIVAPEDATRHPQRHVITQAVGGDRGIRPHVSGHRIEPGDRFVLCTDGLTDMVSEDSIRSILGQERPLRSCARLIDAANDAGGTDNVTVVVIRFNGEPKQL